MRRRRRSVLQRGDQRHRVARHQGLPRAARPRPHVRASARRVSGAGARARPPHGEGGRRDGGLGSVRAARRTCRCRGCSAARAPRSRPACRSASRIRSTSSRRRSATELAAGYRRIKIKIKPGWDVDAVEIVRARFGGIPLMVDANAAYTLADADAPGGARPLRPDDDRAAARVRRHPRSRGAAAADRDADLPRRVDPLRPRGGGGDRARRVPHHQHQAGPRRRARASRSGSTTSARRTASRSGTAACSRAASAARTTSTSRRCRTSRCRATSPRAAATSCPI